MNKTELIWRERTSELEFIASIWTSNASEITSRTVLADPCISIIFVKSASGSEIILRGPETKPRDEILIPDETLVAIRLQPGVILKNFPTEQFIDSFSKLSADSDGRFYIDGIQFQFPTFSNAEQLIERMYNVGYIHGKVIDSKESPKQGISSKSYSRSIKRATGLSPYKLRQLQRIHEVLHLLKQGIPAVEVAAELGFVDQAHLSRAARQFLGHTPKELLQLPQDP